MSKKTEEDNPGYVIYLASKKLKEAQSSNIENLFQLRIIINEALEILEKYAEIK